MQQRSGPACAAIVYHRWLQPSPSCSLAGCLPSFLPANSSTTESGLIPSRTSQASLGSPTEGSEKLCARYDIVPPRGYWAKKTAGKRVYQPKLPSMSDPCRQKIHFELSPKTVVDDIPTPDVHPLVAFEQQKENQISVADQLELTHPLILKTQKRLTKSKRDANGMISAPQGVLHIHTSRAQCDRALGILQTLLSAFESRGFPVTATADSLHVNILDEPLGFGIEEGTKKVEHRISFTEQKQIDRGMGWQVPKWDYEPSGSLTLLITNVQSRRAPTVGRGTA
jgi:hypothetical protein